MKKTWTQLTKKARAAARFITQEKRKLVRELKNRPCADCQQEYPSEAMDFRSRSGSRWQVGSGWTKANSTSYCVGGSQVRRGLCQLSPRQN